MLEWQGFIIQVITVLVPVAAAMVTQNRRITRLEIENKELQEENERLAIDLKNLTERHGELQQRYEATLKQQAGIRDKF